jgi:hypothetical protein
LQKKLSDALKELPELEQATMTLSLERIVRLLDADPDVVLEADDTASPILEVPEGDVPPESGLVV